MSTNTRTKDFMSRRSGIQNMVEEVDYYSESDYYDEEDDVVYNLNDHENK